jgi:hypothetical protein
LRTHWLARPTPSADLFKATTQGFINQLLQAHTTVAAQPLERDRYVVIKC